MELALRPFQWSASVLPLDRPGVEAEVGVEGKVSSSTTTTAATPYANISQLPSPRLSSSSSSSASDSAAPTPHPPSATSAAKAPAQTATLDDRDRHRHCHLYNRADRSEDTLSECNTIPIRFLETDPEVTTALWQDVYETKGELEAAMMANGTSSLITTTTTAATTTSNMPPRLSGYIHIDRTPRCIVPEEHFGSLAASSPSSSSSLFSGDKEHEDNATAPPSPPSPNREREGDFFAILKKLRASDSCRSIDELKEIVGFYLAPRHIAGANLAPAAATTATAANKKLAWLPVRFLRVDPLRNKNNEKTNWQPLPVLDTRHAQHHHHDDYHRPQQNAQKRPQQQGVLACSTASITYWLAPYPNTVSLMLRLQASTYAEGEDYAVCPYLSIEYQLDGEHTDEEAITRLSKAGGAALYNRFLLHERKASKNGAYDGGTDTEMKQGQVVGGRDDCGERDDDTIRHYCIVIGWEKFSVWVIRPTRDSRALDPVEAPPAAFSKTIMSARSSTKPKPEPEPGNTARAPRSWHGDNNIAPNSSLVSHSNHYVNPDSSINNAVQRSRNWRGAQMMRLTGININELSKDLLPQWIERIHRWGTTAYANAVEMDLGWAQGYGKGHRFRAADPGMHGLTEAARNDAMQIAEEERRRWQR